MRFKVLHGGSRPITLVDKSKSRATRAARLHYSYLRYGARPDGCVHVRGRKILIRTVPPSPGPDPRSVPGAYYGGSRGLWD